MAELFVTTNASGIEIYANPELKPERGWSSEIAIKQKLKIHKWNGFIDVAAFVMKYNDMMEFTFGQWGDPITMPLYGLGFKSVNIGETQISGIELSINGQGKINNDLKINLIGGYTYMNPVALEPDKVYTESIGQLVINGETIGPELTYNNSSSDPSILKYRYQHIAKIDIEFLYQDFLFGTSLRYNDFMRNIDKIFTDEWINQELIPGINEAREKYRNGDFIIDLRFGYNIDKNSKVSLIINNLLNEELYEQASRYASPKNNCLSIKFQNLMKVLGIIPARYSSLRFPGKPLVDIAGKSMIQRVYEQAIKCKDLNKVLVATDDDKIFNHVKLFNGNVIITSSNHQSGTDRCAEAVEKNW